MTQSPASKNLPPGSPPSFSRWQPEHAGVQPSSLTFLLTHPQPRAHRVRQPCSVHTALGCMTCFHLKERSRFNKDVSHLYAACPPFRGSPGEPGKPQGTLAGLGEAGETVSPRDKLGSLCSALQMTTPPLMEIRWAPLGKSPSHGLPVSWALGGHSQGSLGPRGSLLSAAIHRGTPTAFSLSLV